MSDWNNEALYYIYLDDTDAFVYDTLEEAEEGMERLRLSCIKYQKEDGVQRVLELWHGPMDGESGAGFLYQVIPTEEEEEDVVE